MIIAVCVNDLIIVASKLPKINEIKSKLTQILKMKDKSSLHYCFTIEFAVRKRSITMLPKKYIDEIIKNYGMMDCNHVSTPFPGGIKREVDSNKGNDIKVPYQNLTGLLMYLPKGARPDIAFTVSFLSQFNT